MSVIPDENIFAYGTLGTVMYFVVAGNSEYLRFLFGLRDFFGGSADQQPHPQQHGVAHASSSAGDLKKRWRELRTKVVREGSWLSEPALFTRWFHLGDFDATSHMSLLTLEAQRLEGLISKYPLVRRSVLDHASRFVNALNKCDHASDMFDSVAALQDLD